MRVTRGSCPPEAYISLSVKRAIFSPVIVKNGLFVVKIGLFVVQNGLIFVQKPGKSGFFQLSLQPPEPYLIYDETYRSRDKKEQKYHDTLAAQQTAPSVIMAYDLLPTSTMSPDWYADTTGLQSRYISPLQSGFHPGIRIFLI